MSKIHLQLAAADHEHLQGLVKKRLVSVKVFKRATALLALDAGQSLARAAAAVAVNYNSVAAWRDRYQEEGLAAALADRPRSGRPVRIEGAERAKITALACSRPPAGHARWSRRLLADKLVELELVGAVSHTQVGRILKKRARPPPQTQDVVPGGAKQPLFGQHGAHPLALRPTLRPALSVGLLRPSGPAT